MGARGRAPAPARRTRGARASGFDDRGMRRDTFAAQLGERRESDWRHSKRGAVARDPGGSTGRERLGAESIAALPRGEMEGERGRAREHCSLPSLSPTTSPIVSCCSFPPPLPLYRIAPIPHPLPPLSLFAPLPFPPSFLFFLSLYPSHLLLFRVLSPYTSSLPSPLSPSPPRPSSPVASGRVQTHDVGQAFAEFLRFAEELQRSIDGPGAIDGRGGGGGVGAVAPLVLEGQPEALKRPYSEDEHPIESRAGVLARLLGWRGARSKGADGAAGANGAPPAWAAWVRDATEV